MTADVSVRTIMERTKVNHEFIIGEHRAGKNVFEVTQLLNSFLGAFAHPWEEWKGDLCRISLQEAHKLGWPSVTPDDPREDTPRTLGDLLRFIRNALMHGNIQFLADKDNDIEALFIWNERSGWRTWGATLDVGTLHRFLQCFEEHAEKLPDSQPSCPPKRHIRDRPAPSQCQCCNQVIQSNFDRSS